MSPLDVPTGTGSGLTLSSPLLDGCSHDKHFDGYTGIAARSWQIWMNAVEPDWRPTTNGNVHYFIMPITHVSPDGPIQAADLSVSRAIFAIRRCSGLDWHELAQLFAVSRQQLREWSNGGAMEKDDRGRVKDTLKALRHICRRTSRDTREHLFTTDDDTGETPFDLLCSKRFDAVLALPAGDDTPPHARPELSGQAKALRRPESPMLLLDADQSRPVFSTAPRVACVMRAPPAEE